jgi:glycerophosphoryl diester phosphodiesterase
LTAAQAWTYAVSMPDRIDLQGHRGARGLLPENTLVGFAGALAVGVDTLELDVALTADDVVVVTHDARLNPDITRLGAGEWLEGPGPAIRSLKVAELARYDVGRIRPGCAYAALHPDQVPHDGATIPTLAEVLRINREVNFTIELKSIPWQQELAVGGAALAEAVVAVAAAGRVTARITVQSFDWRGLRHLRRARPEIRVAWLTRSAILSEARLWWDGPHPRDFSGSVPRAVAAEGGAIWAPEHVDLTEETLAEAHDLGLCVVPWTVNQPSEMHRLIRWGVDGLITDRPDLARRVLADQGHGLPPLRRAEEIGRR